METLNLILDLILIMATVWAIFVVRGLGGTIGSAFNMMMWGMIFLGFAHIAETVTFQILELDVAVIEFSHRLIVLFGFILLIFGFNQIRKFK